MKNRYYLAVILFGIMITSCSVDHTNNDLTITETEKQHLNDLFSTSSLNEQESCLTVNLIAGQNHTAGTVSVAIRDGNFIITYSTNEDWLIYGTHLSINNCVDDDFPTTESGNPKVGRFEYSTNNSTGVTEVVYTIEASDFKDRFCFAAHAEVTGPTGGETAWAEGEDFPGKNWAMYVEGSILDCNTEEPDDEEPNDEEPDDEEPDDEEPNDDPKK